MELPIGIDVAFINHTSQRYDTAGDYSELGGWWAIQISKTKDPRHAMLVMVHEIVEMILTKQNGVNWSSIDEFDTIGEGKDHSDPGTMPSAPYHNEHMLATQIEKKLAKMMGVDWEEYNQALDEMEY